MSVTLVLIVAGGLETWRSYSSTRELTARQLRLGQLQGVVIHLDEVLTMSARMAAATEQLVWETRYHRAEPELDAAIKDMLALAPDAQIETFSAQTDAANRALVAMETSAFALVRGGEAARGSEILFGTEYARQKKIYAAGMASTMTALSASMQDALDAHGRRIVLEVVFASLFLVVAVFAWGRAVWQLRARSRRLAEALSTSERDNAALADAHQQLEKLHHELIAKEKLSNLGLLAAGVAHEINNPMAFVTMNVHTLLEDLRDIPADKLPEDLRVYLDELLPATIDGIQRVNTIVRDLQQFARGDVDVTTDFDLNAEIATAARISNNQVKDRARLELSLGTLPTLHGKPRQMTQVMVNLIVNAAHAIGDRPSGSIQITSALVEDRAVVTVRDNGAGMSREVMDHVFQPFFTTKDVGKGTGLGLSVVYGIVSAHGGTITVDSEVGVGTSFRLELPVVASSEPLAQAA